MHVYVPGKSLSKVANVIWNAIQTPSSVTIMEKSVTRTPALPAPAYATFE